MRTAQFWAWQFAFVFHFWLPFWLKQRSWQILFAKVKCWLNFQANLNVDLCSEEEDGGLDAKSDEGPEEIPLGSLLEAERKSI